MPRIVTVTLCILNRPRRRERNWISGRAWLCKASYFERTVGSYRRRVQGRDLAPSVDRRQLRDTAGTFGACRIFQSRAPLSFPNCAWGDGDARTSSAYERPSLKDLRQPVPLHERLVASAKLVRLFGHAAGGRTSERLLRRLAIPVSDNAILRQLKRHARERCDCPPSRAIAIDDWGWRKGFTYGTIIVDLEHRVVVDVLGTRSAKETNPFPPQKLAAAALTSARRRAIFIKKGARLGFFHASPASLSLVALRQFLVNA